MAQITLNSSGVASSGSLLLQTNGTTTQATLDTTGNLGLGVTPSAWGGTSKAIQFSTGAFEARSASFSSNTNAYFNSGWLYVGTGRATLYNQTDGQHVWYNSASGTAGNAISFTQAMTLDASGNLGLGTTSPDSNAGYAFMTTNGSSGSGFHAQSGGTTVTKIEGVTGGTNITAEGARNIQFYTNSTERARIDSTGRMSIGTTSTVDSATLSILAVGGTVIGSRVAVNGNYVLAAANSSGTVVGGVIANASTTSFPTSSDYRLKENIAPMTGALAKVSQLKPCTYTWKSNGQAGQGFIAHELAAVVPDAVVGTKDAVDEHGNPKYQGIDTSFLVATLTAAIQELNAKFEAYKAAHP